MAVAVVVEEDCLEDGVVEGGVGWELGLVIGAWEVLVSKGVEAQRWWDVLQLKDISSLVRSLGYILIRYMGLKFFFANSRREDWSLPLTFVTACSSLNSIS